MNAESVSLDKLQKRPTLSSRRTDLYKIGREALPPLIDKKRNKRRPKLEDLPVELLLREIACSNKGLNSEDVYTRLLTEMNWDELHNKIKADYPLYSKSMMRRLGRRLGGDFVKLLADPSVATRLDDFMNFVAAQKSEGKRFNPMEARQAFRESLGTTKVYRVVCLPEAELQVVLQEGFVAGHLRKKNWKKETMPPIDQLSIEHWFSNLTARMNLHSGAFADSLNSLFVSVSQVPGLAAYAASVQLKEYHQELKTAGYKYWVVPIEIEEFLLIKNSVYAHNALWKKNSGYWKNTGGDIMVPYGDHAVESLVEFRIQPENICKADIYAIDIDKVDQFTVVNA